jgi:hypothetical protein
MVAKRNIRPTGLDPGVERLDQRRQLIQILGVKGVENPRLKVAAQLRLRG